jgi:hypothetical protein
MFRSSLREPLFRGISLANLILTLLLACAAATTSAFACNKAGKGPGCKDSNPMLENRSLAEVNGTNAYFFSPALVNCATDAALGGYVCASPNGMYFSSYSMSGIFARRFWDICHTFAPNDSTAGLLSPDRLSYGWTDDCSDGVCAVEVRLDFAGLELQELTDGQADRMNMIMYGKAFESGQDDPFANDQEIVIERIELQFFRPGSKRSAGTCEWYTDLSGDQVKFWSFDQ